MTATEPARRRAGERGGPADDARVEAADPTDGVPRVDVAPATRPEDRPDAGAEQLDEQRDEQRDERHDDGQPDGPRGLSRLLGLVTQIAAPVTLVGALLFYFGYVFARAQYEYFGLDVDTIGLTPRDFVMRSPQALLVPMLVLTVVVVAGLTLLARVDRRVRAARRDAAGAERVARVARRWASAGAGVLLVGLVLVGAYAWWGAWEYLTLVAALTVGVGAAITASGLRYVTAHVPGTVAGLWVLVLATALWSVAITAEWSGRGFAQEQARHLDTLPAVILDSPEDLHLRNTVAPPEDLCWTTGDAPDPACAARVEEPRYRYRGLRLLVQGPTAMFLVPSDWSPHATTLLVPRDTTARLQFQFVNVAP